MGDWTGCLSGRLSPRACRSRFVELGADRSGWCADASSSQRVPGLAAGQDDARPPSPHPYSIDTAIGPASGGRVLGVKACSTAAGDPDELVTLAQALGGRDAGQIRT